MSFLSEAPGTHLGEIVRQFTPNWFAANMGTGILALMLASFPYGHWGQLWLAKGLWSINVFFFLLFLGLIAGRAVFYFDSFKRLYNHPIQSMFIGAIPMGLATIINGFVLIWPISPESMSLAYALWWVDVAMSLWSVFVVPYFMFSAQEHSVERMTAVWLLPIVPPEVAAASGGLVAQHISPALGTTVVYLSYMMWAISVLLALAVLAILFLRLTLHKLPHRDMAVSAWLPLGPIGTGAMAMITLGAADLHAFQGTDLLEMAHFGQMAGLFVALVLWGFGIWWMVMAIAFTLRYLNEGLPFNMGWWGFTFPLGVYNSATYLLAKETGYFIFLPLGALFTIALAFFWGLVTYQSFTGMWTGRLFRAPCLSVETGMLDDKCEVEALQSDSDLMETLRKG